MKKILLLIFAVVCSANIFGQTLEKGYRGFAGVDGQGVVNDNGYDGISFWTSHGCQINPFLFVGGGLSSQVRYCADDLADEFYSYNLIPVFGNVRFDYPNSKISAFADLKMGYTVGDYSGLYIAPSVGFRLSHCNWSLGYEMQQMELDVYGYNLGNVNCGSIMFTISFDWGARNKNN